MKLETMLNCLIAKLLKKRYGVRSVEPNCIRLGRKIQPPPPPFGRVLLLSKEENFVFVAENEEHDLWLEFLCLTCGQISGQDNPNYLIATVE